MSYSFSENPWGEKYVEELNRSDFANLKSTDFFSSVLDLDLDKENTLHIIVGSDSGLLLRYLKQQPLGRGSRIVVVEHDDVYPMIAAEYRGLLSSDSTEDQNGEQTLCMYSHSDWREAVFDGSDKAWVLGGQICVNESHASAADYSRLYTELHRSVRVAVEERMNDMSITLNRSVFTQMQFHNAADSTKPLKRSASFGKGKTAIVLGGGPSLDLHIDWVQANRDKLFVLAVSRIANKLINIDMKPDLLVSVDPMDISYEVCKQGLLWNDVPLVYNYHVSAKLLQQWQGPAFLLGKRLPWHDASHTQGYIASAGPTVGHTSVFVASQLGFSCILMSGIDMCFSSSASTHAGDSPEQMIQTMPSLCDTQVETYSQRLAGTSLLNKKGLDALEDLGALINKDDAILFNLSKEAARCPSIPFMDFNSVALQSRRPDIADLMDVTVRSASSTELNELERDLKHARHRFAKIRGLCAKARDCVVRMHSSDAGSEASKHSRKLTRIREQLENEFPNFLDAIMHENGAAFSKTNTPTDFTEMTAEELIAWGCHFYDLLDNGAKTMIRHIDNSAQRVDLRRDEMNPEVDVRALMKRWRDDGTPGRILKWKSLHWSQVAAQDRAWVQRSIGKFRATLNELNAQATRHLAGSGDDISPLMKSLLFLCQNGKLNELEAIESKLDNHGWPYGALKPFVCGLIQQIEEDNHAALPCFQKSIDICSNRLAENPDYLNSMERLIEECLVRMTHCYIQINDQQSALTTLGMLCEMLPTYIVSYAKMLHACGQEKFAIELLESYVELYPGNKKASFLLRNLGSGKASAPTAASDPAYVSKISGAVQAIMGGSPEQAA